MWFTKRIYADAAASMPVSPASLRRFNRLCALYGNPGGLHKEAVAAKDVLELARREVADAIGAHADEIVFTSGGTESNNLAIQGALRNFLREGKRAHAVTCAIEHPSILEPLMLLEDEGLEVTYLPVSDAGLVDARVLREAIRPETVFVTIQLVNSEIGTIQHMGELAKEIRHARRARGDADSARLPLMLHTDASQAPLWLPLNVEKPAVDFMTLDGQKLGAPRGIGILYVRRGTGIEPLLRGGGQERGVRSGTENVALAGAFAEALTEATAGVETRAARVSAVRDFLMTEIKQQLPEAAFNGPALPDRVCNNINVSIPELDSEMAVIALDVLGIAASTRSACGTDDEDPSYVVAAVAGKDRAREAIRFTLTLDASLRDAKRIAQALAEVAAKYRGHRSGVRN